MGLFDKVKNLKSNLTGDWADVSIQFEPVARGDSVEASTTITVKDSAITIEGVLIEVRCEEIIDVPNATHYSTSSSTSSGTGRATSTETVFEKAVKAAGPQELAGGSSSTFSASVPIPAHEPPTMNGRNCRYEWEIRARVEMKGNDPDSGWQDLQIS
jgi:hypothetical protein